MYKFSLYYDKKASYQNKIKPIIKALKKIQSKWKADFSTIDSETLHAKQVERIKKDIRGIPPQIRGKIVSGRNRILPFSRSKNLNTKNTPILILYHNEIPVNVYPHMLGTTYFEIDHQLQRIFENGLESHLTARGLLEEPIQKIIADNPSILGERLLFKDANKDVGFGVADVILQDAEGKVVVVEIETKATETAVAQVSRLAAGLISQDKLLPSNLRKLIVCHRFDDRTVKACKGANVELYILTTEKIC